MSTEKSASERRTAAATAMAAAIRQRRRTLEMGQTQLAEHLGTSQAQISRIEHGQANPTLATLLRLEEVLGMRLLALEQSGAPKAARGTEE